MNINGIEYFSAAEVAKEAGVSRQTLWRWRTEGQVPAGRRFRGHLLLFSDLELQTIRQYANRLEPSTPVLPRVAGEWESHA